MLDCLRENPVACASAAEAWVGEQWEWTLLLATLGFWRLAVGGMLSKPGSRERLAGWLRRDSYARAYRGALEWALDRLDAWLTPLEVLARPPTDWRRAWTVMLYDRCLLLAVVYPSLIFIVAWGWTGGAAKVGETILLYGDPGIWRRWLAVMGPLCIFALIALPNAEHNDNDGSGQPLFFLVALTVSFGMAFVVISSAVRADTLPFAMITAGCFFALDFGSTPQHSPA